MAGWLMLAWYLRLTWTSVQIDVKICQESGERCQVHVLKDIASKVLDDLHRVILWWLGHLRLVRKHGHEVTGWSFQIGGHAFMQCWPDRPLVLLVVWGLKNQPRHDR